MDWSPQKKLDEFLRTAAHKVYQVKSLRRICNEQEDQLVKNVVEKQDFDAWNREITRVCVHDEIIFRLEENIRRRVVGSTDWCLVDWDQAMRAFNAGGESQWRELVLAAIDITEAEVRLPAFPPPASKQPDSPSAITNDWYP